MKPETEKYRDELAATFGHNGEISQNDFKNAFDAGYKQRGIDDREEKTARYETGYKEGGEDERRRSQKLVEALEITKTLWLQLMKRGVNESVDAIPVINQALMEYKK